MSGSRPRPDGEHNRYVEGEPEMVESGSILLLMRACSFSIACSDVGGRSLRLGEPSEPDNEQDGCSDYQVNTDSGQSLWEVGVLL